MPQQGALYDGVSARAHEVTAAGDGDRLRLESEGWRDQVPASVLRTLSSDARRLRLGRSDIEGWSLILDQPVGEDIAGLIPKGQGYGRWIDRLGLGRALAVFGALTCAVVAVGYMAPQWLAPHVPMRWERRLGSAAVGDFGGMRCRSTDGQRALEALVEKVAPGATKGPDGIKVTALDVPVFNAAALPGGYIVVFKPAIAETNTDALAGVLAHEVAHVRRRHVTKALIREMGIGALIRLFAGQAGSNAEQFLDLSYTRADEAQADSDAIEMLKKAHIDPRPTAELFRGLAKEAPGFSAEFLESHPASSKRAVNFARSFDPRARYQQPLGATEADALKDVCYQNVKRP